MAETLSCWGLSTTINQSSRTADRPVSYVMRRPAVARAIPTVAKLATEEVEKIGIYTIVDTLPRFDEMEDDEELASLLARSRDKG